MAQALTYLVVRKGLDIIRRALSDSKWPLNRLREPVMAERRVVPSSRRSSVRQVLLHIRTRANVCNHHYTIIQVIKITSNGLQGVSEIRCTVTQPSYLIWTQFDSLFLHLFLQRISLLVDTGVNDNC